MGEPQQTANNSPTPPQMVGTGAITDALRGENENDAPMHIEKEGSKSDHPVGDPPVVQPPVTQTVWGERENAVPLCVTKEKPGRKQKHKQSRKRGKCTQLTSGASEVTPIHAKLGPISRSTEGMSTSYSYKHRPGPESLNSGVVRVNKGRPHGKRHQRNPISPPLNTAFRPLSVFRCQMIPNRSTLKKSCLTWT